MYIGSPQAKLSAVRVVFLAQLDCPLEDLHRNMKLLICCCCKSSQFFFFLLSSDSFVS